MKEKPDTSIHAPNYAPYSHPYMGYDPSPTFSKHEIPPAQYYPTPTAGDPIFTAGNNWDLSNFLLSQMGYAGEIIPGHTNVPSSQVPLVSEETITDEYMSSWSEAPVAFKWVFPFPKSY